MSNHQNEVIQEQAIKDYEKQLANMTWEELMYEFNDCLGCDPYEFYTNKNNCDDMEKICETLVDSYAVRLHRNPDLVLENKLDEHVRKINALTKQINRN